MIFGLSTLPELFGYHARMGENGCNFLTENSAALDLRLSIFLPKLNILGRAAASRFWFGWGGGGGGGVSNENLPELFLGVVRRFT